MNKQKWGFLRETTDKAIEAGIDKDTGLHRTGLNEYLKVIFPKIKDWVHDETIPNFKVNGKISRLKPDYRSESLKMIVEFDGIHHYKYIDNILKDYEKIKIYSSNNYKVIRIPYFIQLSKKAVKTFFDIDIEENLFDDSIPSLGLNGNNTPAYLCPLGVQRMALEFRNFPEQYKTNIKFLKSQNDEYRTGYNLLEVFYNSK